MSISLIVARWPCPTRSLVNHALADMRDLLLPRLVTGQIDVCEVDLDALTESVA